MSYSPTSNLVFGIFIDEQDLKISTQVRGCTHNCDLNAKFCFTCGQPVHKEEMSDIADQGSFDETNTVGFFKSSCYSTDGILGVPLLQTQDQDTGYYVVPQPTKKQCELVKQFLVDNNFMFDEEDVQVYVYTYHG